MKRYKSYFDQIFEELTLARGKEITIGKGRIAT
jgi:hypothetical protein